MPAGAGRALSPHRGIERRTGNRRARDPQHGQDRQRGQRQAPRAAQELPLTAKPHPRPVSLGWAVPARPSAGRIGLVSQCLTDRAPSPLLALPVPGTPQPSPPSAPSIPVAQATLTAPSPPALRVPPSPPTTQLPLQQESALVNQCSRLLICVFQAERRGRTRDRKSQWALPQGARRERGIGMVQGPLGTVGCRR